MSETTTSGVCFDGVVSLRKLFLSVLKIDRWGLAVYYMVKTTSGRKKGLKNIYTDRKSSHPRINAVQSIPKANKKVDARRQRRLGTLRSPITLLPLTSRNC